MGIKERIKESLSGQILHVSEVNSFDKIIVANISKTPALIVNPDFSMNFIDTEQVELPEITILGKGPSEEIAIDTCILEFEYLVFKLLKTCALHNDNEISLVPYNDLKEGLESLMFQVERNRLLVDKFIASKEDMPRFTKELLPLDLDPIVQRETLWSKFAQIWGVNIFVTGSPQLSSGEFLAITEGKYLGHCFIKECTSSIEDNFTVVTSKLALGILNIRGVSFGVTKDRASVQVSYKYKEAYKIEK